MIVKQDVTGEYYVYRRTSKNVSRNWWLVKSDRNGYGRIFLIHKNHYFFMTLPQSLVGKRVRIKIEQIE